MSSTGNIPSNQEGTPFSLSGSFSGHQNQQWQPSGQSQDWQQDNQSQQWQQRDQSQQWQDRDRSQQWQQSGQDQDWNKSGFQSGGANNDMDDGNFRPTNVQGAREGGVAIDDREGLPQGKASITDKFMGKVEKVAGKMTNNPEKHERGELREAGGKGAERGEARTAHD